MRRTLLVALLSGLVVGTCLAGLPHVQNEPCLHSAVGLGEGTGYSGGIGLWPLRTTCEFSGAGGSRVVEHGAGVGEGLLWVALASVLFVVAAVSRSPASRGAAGAATLLALVAFGWHFGGEAVPAGMLALTLGFPLVYAVDWALWTGPSMAFVAMLGKRTVRWRWGAVRETGPPTAARSAATAAAVVPATLFAWVVGDFGGFPYVGIAGGLLAGAGAAVAADRIGRALARTAVAR